MRTTTGSARYLLLAQVLLRRARTTTGLLSIELRPLCCSMDDRVAARRFLQPGVPRLSDSLAAPGSAIFPA